MTLTVELIQEKKKSDEINHCILTNLLMLANMLPEHNITMN